MLLLTKQRLLATKHLRIKEEIEKRHPQVIFRNITYEDICNSCLGLFEPHEFEMKDLVDDYVEYCNDVNLFDQSAHLLRIVPCGKSIELNAKYGMYFHPNDRGYTRHRFEGIYSNRSVRHLIDLGDGSVFDVDLVGVDLRKRLVEGANTKKYDADIKSMIRDAKKECGYEISKGHIFFCGDICATDYRKSTPYGIQGSRFINLKKAIGAFSGLKEVAQKLQGLTWT